MAVENVGKFMHVLRESEEIQEKMFKLLEEGSKVDALILLAGEYGYDFDAEEALSWGKSAALHDDDKLSEEDLEAVSGGAAFSAHDLPVSLFLQHLPKIQNRIKTRS
tara:strand:- start:82 stop:402 length:321 start_codon:yes stop_codon:yes gene_type:complete